MTESSRSGTGPVTEATGRKLGEIRRALLLVHKALLDSEQRAYERSHGRVETTGELLQIVLHDPRFAWLKMFSELVVRIEELQEADEPAREDQALALIREVHETAKPSEVGSRFERKYYAALQRDPGVVIAHGELMRVIGDK